MTRTPLASTMECCRGFNEGNSTSQRSAPSSAGVPGGGDCDPLLEEKRASFATEGRNLVHGDLLQLAHDGKLDVIVHGCNCYCAMGAGIAKQIRDQFPAAHTADKKTTKGARSKLGTYSSTKIVVRDENDDDDDEEESDHHTFRIVNAYTQHHWKGGSGGVVLANSDAIRAVFAKIKKDFSGKRIGYPKIGAGLAGGDWKEISSIINKELEGEDHTLVIYQRHAPL